MVMYVDLGKEIFEKIQDTELHFAIYLERERENMQMATIRKYRKEQESVIQGCN